MVSIKMGDRIQVSRHSKALGATETFCHNEYEYSHGIFIEMAEWRIDDGTYLLCGSKSPNVKLGQMPRGLDRLIDASVLNTEVKQPSMDLYVQLDNGLRLVLFANCMDCTNYYFFVPGWVFVIDGANTVDKRLSKRGVKP
jgi:hypothetical protein